MKNIRKPAVAGMFYPSGSQKLKDEIELLLSVSDPKENIENVFGIISPHAGYIYSGRTAAYGFNLLKNKNIKTVVIISPSHREYFPGISIYDGDGYETPLGFVPVNQEMTIKIISKAKSIFRSSKGHRDEHAIEVQIPFLQTVLNDFSIVPIVMGDQSSIYVNELADMLADSVDENTVIVSSSDLSHYYTHEEANRLDSVIEERINDFDFNSLQKDFDLRNCEACGGGPILSMMKAANKLNKKHSKVLHRTDSAYTSGDYSQVVGYLSAVIYG